MAPCLSTICRRIRKNRTSKIIAIVDNMLPHEKRPGDYIFSKYFTKSVDAFIAMSEKVYHDITIFDSQKPKKVTPHPIYDHYGKIEEREAALNKLDLPLKNRYLLFFGFIRDYKGLDLLLKAFADPYFSNKKIKLIIAGEFYSNKEKYLEMIKELGIKKRLILRTDFIPDTEVQNYFNACDLVAQPYKEATQSGVTQIGYHFNKPMLVTNVGGLPEIIAHMKIGYVVEPQPEKITESIIDFYENSRAKTFIENIFEEKKKFEWDKMTSAIYELKKEISDE
jgi:glycosyltransferase involved in cell wall biosynthesis